MKRRSYSRHEIRFTFHVSQERETMPKLKTNRGAKKRFSMTKKGKIKAKKSKLRHILSTKPRKQKRRLKETLYVSKADTKRIKQLLPNGA